tara:strand:+ start:28297 stop:28845 length:549 start_codon:yes stop_codon:yes gene_type:complete
MRLTIEQIKELFPSSENEVQRIVKDYNLKPLLSNPLPEVNEEEFKEFKDKTMPQETEVRFKIETYQKNRIVNKIIKGLKEDENFTVTKVESDSDSRIFDVLFLSITGETWNEVFFMTRLSDLIRDRFPTNYQFNFVEKRLGFTYCFKITTNQGKEIDCYSRKKEIRTDGTSVLPKAKNQIIL